MKTSIVIFTYLIIQINCYSQNFYFGGSLSRNWMLFEITESKTKFLPYNAYRLSLDFQKRQFNLSFRAGINYHKLSFDRTLLYYGSYSHGQYAGQYSETRTTHHLKYETKIHSLDLVLHPNFSLSLKSRFSFTLGLQIGYQFPISQKVIKDSLIKSNYHEYSNQPAGIYNETTTYIYSNSSETNLELNFKKFSLTPTIGLRYLSKNSKLMVLFSAGLKYMFSPILTMSYEVPYSTDYYEIRQELFTEFTIGYKLSKK